ncbi:MAG: GAF domain-containing protein [Anaerolineae bacterium]
MSGSASSFSTPDLSLRATRPIAILSLIVAVAMLALTPILALDWVSNMPFPGVLVSPHLLVTDGSGPGWGPDAQLDILDRIVEVNGTAIADQATFDQAMVDAYARPDRSAQIKYERSTALNSRECGTAVDGNVRRCETTRSVQRAEPGDLGRLFGMPYAIGFTYLLIGMWVFRQRGRQRSGQALAFFCALTAIDLALFFDQMSTNLLGPVYLLALGLTSGSLFNLAVVFPQSPHIVERRPTLRFVGYLPGLTAALVGILALANAAAPWDYIYALRWLFALIIVSAASYLGSLVYRRLRSDSPVVRQQSRIILWGTLLAFLPTVLWGMQGIVNPNVPYNTILYLPSMVLFPLAIGYAMLRYNLLNVDRLITGGITYVIMGALMILAYVGIVSALTVLLREQTALITNPLMLLIFVVLVAVIFDILRLRLNRLIDRLLFRGRLDTETVLQNYSRSLTEVADLPMIVNAMRTQVTEMYHPERQYIYLLDSQLDLYIAQPEVSSNGARFAPQVAQCPTDSALVKWLNAEPGPKYLSPTRALPDILQPDRERINAIGAVVYVPLTGRDRGNGWLALGPRQNDQPYSTDDLNFLQAIANQTALALERAIVFDDLQRRVNELNALSRISQAVNFTLDVDDILELIYTQTSRVLDTRNFYIAMAERQRGTLRFAFYIENGERLYPDDEWPLDLGLSGEVMRRGLAIIADDYVTECEKRGLNPGGRPGQAWMGVPLNASNQPMGLMVVSDFRPEITYSQEQLQVFAAIADQAASVLYKTQLYHETEERARQLAVLNEVGSSITSTLDLRTVLETIVAKAIELLRAEAGSLLLVDESTNELVFEVTFGPAASELRGQRLPLGKGIVGAVAQTRQPQIVNEAQTDVRWLRDVDQSTAFITRALLAVPMITKNRVIGVLELINKRDADRYTEDDQKLLTAFATNAAVAVENARLFTLTDQALASRLEELSTLQEIDRQLNTSLDIRRVLDLTLDWGLRMVDANAGSIAVVNRDTNSLDLVVARNYTYQPVSLPMDQGLAGQVARTNQPILVNDVTLDRRYIAAAPSTQSQLSVPIKRENAVIAVMNLESSRLNAFGILQLDSASRLADHAATAIINAQLYEEVKRANDAKSEFVSIVSHELKTPMTSMKGYTDLLVKGMAGPVSDMQAQFLNVIRANVDRMSTLVNDLLEVSRIETGRLKLDVKPLEMALVLDETLRTTKAQIEDRQQTLELSVPETLPLVTADKARVIQVLTNLISNAYKYTPTGGHITIEVTPQTVVQPPHAMKGDIPASQIDHNFVPNPAGYVWCAVKDTGVGISAEDQAKLFQKFFRSGDQAVRDQPGTGLGLSITKSLIELQKGAIWVESEVGTGSTFAFSLPVEENAAG